MEIRGFPGAAGADGDRPHAVLCYVQLAEEAGLSDRLAGLSLEQKQCLWWLFLERRVYPPEFEWLWSELAGDWPGLD